MIHDPQISARGSAPVATLATVSPVEAAVVRYLRAWCEGPDGQAQVWTDLSVAFGPHAAAEGLDAFQDLLDMVLRCGRRPLMRHQQSCSCIGADEAVFAQMVLSAATGEQEDAMLIASLLVQGQALPKVTDAARRVGCLLLRCPLAGAAYPSSQTRH